MRSISLLFFVVLLLVLARSTSAQESPVTSSSYMTGIVNGCIDGQRKILTSKGVDFNANAAAVRQYCHCMAPITADISRSPEGRIKLLSGNLDPDSARAVRNAEAICVDAVRADRSFITQAVSADTYSSLKEAYGEVVGAYWGAISAAEACRSYASTSADALVAGKNFVDSNVALYTQIERRMSEIARIQGGAAGADALRAEIQSLIGNKNEMLAEIRKSINDEAKCRTVVNAIRAGAWDISNRKAEQMKFILSR